MAKLGVTLYFDSSHLIKINYFDSSQLIKINYIPRIDFDPIIKHT